jgi:hypothetical protein
MNINEHIIYTYGKLGVKSETYPLVTSCWTYSYGLEGPFVDGEHDDLPFLKMVIFRSYVKLQVLQLVIGYHFDYREIPWNKICRFTYKISNVMLVCIYIYIYIS